MKLRLLGAFASVLAFASCAGTGRMLSGTEKGPTFGGIVLSSGRTANYCPGTTEGQPCAMTWDLAKQFCASDGGHLPTAREYANMLEKKGVKILEPADVPSTPPPGYYLVDCLNPDGAHDAFYMNHQGYQRGPDDETGHLLWTASKPPQHQEYAHVYYDEWGGGGGDPKDHLLVRKNDVRCAYGE